MPIEVSIAQHVGARAEQQDTAEVRRALPGFATDAVAAVVADGMGGHRGGAEASRLAVEAFLAALGRTSHGEPTPDVLHRAIGAAGRSVLDGARAAGLVDDMGTTLVGLIAENETFSWVSVGDSAVFRLRDGRLDRLNTPHTLGARLDRAVAEGRMDATEAAAHAQRHALTSYLGKPSLDEVDGSAAPVPLRPDDVIVLCSDGLFGTLAPGEIADVLARTPTPSAAQALVDATLARGVARQDNVTACVLRRTAAPAATFVATPPGSVATPAAGPVQPTTPTQAVAWRPLAGLAAVAAVGLGAWLLWSQRDHAALVPVAPVRPDSAQVETVRSDSLRRDSLGAAVPGDTLAPRDTLVRIDTLVRTPPVIAPPPGTPSPPAPAPVVPGPATSIPRT